MYRCFNFRNITLQNAYKISNVENVPKTCSFCNLCHHCSPKLLQIRYHSSNTDFDMLSPVKRKRFKRKFKNYAELLEVTNSATNNRKAAVQKLNAKHLSKLVDQPNVTLDKLEKIYYTEESKHKRNEQKSQSMNNMPKDLILPENFTNSLDNLNIFPSNELMNNINQKERFLNLEQNDEIHKVIDNDFPNNFKFDEISYLNDFINKKSAKKCVEREYFFKLMNEKKLELNTEDNKSIALNSKERSKFSDIMISAYMNVYAYSHNSNSTSKMFQWFNRLKSSDNVYITNINVYNILVEKFSFELDIQGILDTLDFLRKHEIKPNPQTYAHVFYCIARLKDNDIGKSDIINRIQKELDFDEISLNDVLVKSIFVKDQREYVKKFAKTLNNEFEPIYPVPDIQYDCPLLTCLIGKNAPLRSTVEDLIAPSDVETLLKEQIKMELNGLTTIESIAKKSKNKRDILNLREKVSNLEKVWRNATLEAFNKNLKMLKNIESFKSQQIPLYPYLTVLSPEEYINIIMRKAQKIALISDDYSVAYISMCYDAGFQVYQKYEAQVKKKYGVHDKIIKIYKQYSDWFIKRNDEHNCREKWSLLAHEANKDGVSIDFNLPKWPSSIYAAIGKFLLEILINDCKVNESIVKKNNYKNYDMPAFFKVFRNSGLKMQEQLKPHPIVSQLYKESDLDYLTFETTLVPLVCPPLPWVSMYQGGYAISPSDLIRLDVSYKQLFEKKVLSAPKNLYPALDSLNQLSSIPWSVNSKILDVAIQVFQNDGSEKFHIPQPPSVLGPLPRLPKNVDDEQKKKIIKERFSLHMKKNEMYSVWCDTLYKLSLANHFRKKIFWLPHNMDFRGRVYPIPPHINHLGSDLSRSLLVFALKKPLGPKGLDWLKVHAINLTGLKKRDPIKNRLIYANTIMDKILDSAEKPLTGQLWWTKSDNPWQTLAACMEIAAALKSPDPENFLSGFPVHQDGSCNGLQHYAALGRDKIGALSVNLHPSDVPQDVYSSVASAIEEICKKDIEAKNEIAMLLNGHITRKVIKQTVMTTVYGVTMYGAKLQILRQLKDGSKIPEESLWEATSYLTVKTFEALKTMFRGAKEIQDWFLQCSDLICKVRQENMEWITPLGFPVVQPYASHSHIPKHKLDTKTMYSVFKLKPDSRKQKNAFAPNFIHSLDSSHMMLTSLHCEREGIAFVSVHDCFWTHPSTVEIMNKVCREQFVLLHSQPILQDLSTFFYKNFGFDLSTENVPKKQLRVYEKLNSVLLKVPKQGDFDINQVLDSVYFFS